MWASEERAVELECGDVCVVNTSGDAAAAPRDVVLRLLAAEASDRLGWVWEVGGNTARGRKGIDSVDWSVCPVDGIRTESDLYLFGPDDVLASLVGRFLLEDAMKEGA